jgi:hypothetical protein
MVKEKGFESQVQKVARTKNGGAIDADLFWDIVIALDTDSEKRHTDTVSLLAAHTQEDTERSARIARDLKSELDEFRVSQAHECAIRHKELFHTELATLGLSPTPPISGPAMDGKSLQDIIMGWRLGKWMLAIIFVAVVGWGLPFWADSCARGAAESLSGPEPAGHVITTEPSIEP